ncbi:MAG: VanZ family protein [Clostridiales bacterium]|jgi:glycopeptide antibiotics resistance protein|nr:VanZ family protein [Clostridiales bacterium]
MRDKQANTRRIVIALLILYAAAMLFILVIPNNFRRHNVIVGGLTFAGWLGYVENGFNLVPFSGIAEQVGSVLSGQNVTWGIVYLAGNLVGFAPLGFFLPSLFSRQRKLRVFLVAAVVVIAILEATQLLTMRGSFDIDDIILNVAGACIGFFLLRDLVRRIAGLKEDCAYACDNDG